MPKTQKVFLILAMCITAAQPVSGQTRGQEKTSATTVVVLDFELGDIDSLPEESGVLLAELLAIELARSDLLSVLERQHFQDLLAQDALRLTGQAGDRRLAASAQRPSAQYLIGGKAFSLGNKRVVSVSLTDTQTGFAQALVYECSTHQTIIQIAQDLGSQIRHALLTRTPATPSGPPPSSVSPPGPASALNTQHRLQLPRVSVVIKETLLGTPSQPSIAQAQLNTLLLERHFRVRLPDPSIKTWLEKTNGFPETSPVHLPENIDAIILGHATTQPGLRTENLASAKAHLELRIYQLRKKKTPQTLTVDAKALDGSVESAARQALRRAASRAVETALKPLLEATP